jgi:hypothetical protein
MITANEANDLVFEGVKNEYDKYVEEVERNIRIAAMDGQRSVIVPIEINTAKEQEALRLLINELKENGFYAVCNAYGLGRRMKWEIFVSW